MPSSPAAPSCGLTDLYVATSNGGDFTTDATLTRRRGSVSDPFVRITDAVARARAERGFGVLPAENEIRIHVGPGRYVGSYFRDQLEAHPEYEVLRIILNVPRLALLGSTVLLRDARGLPTASDSATESILEYDQPDQPRGRIQSLLLIARTADGAIGDDVTVDGFVLQGKDLPTYLPFPTSVLFIDRVSDFTIRNSIVRHGGWGITTRLASGSIEGNLLTQNDECGAFVTAGSIARPATVLMHGNRVAGSRQGMPNYQYMGVIAAGIPTFYPVEMGGNALELQPLETTFDRNSSADLQRIPDKLTITVTGNDISGFNVYGVRLIAVFPLGVVCSGPAGEQTLGYETADASQPLTSVIVADVRDNTISGGLWGLGLEVAFGCRNDPRPLHTMLSAHLGGNSFGGGQRQTALLTFDGWFDFFQAPGFDPTVRFPTESLYEVTDDDAGFTFDYDNPLTDPIDGVTLNNTLRANGVEIAHGKSFP